MGATHDPEPLVNAHTSDLTLETEPSLVAEHDGGTLRLVASGEWVGTHIATLDKALRASDQAGANVIFDLRAVTRMDTAGAWLVERARRDANAFELVGATDEQRRLLDAVRLDDGAAAEPRRRPPFLERFGLGAQGRGRQARHELLDESPQRRAVPLECALDVLSCHALTTRVAQP